MQQYRNAKDYWTRYTAVAYRAAYPDDWPRQPPDRATVRIEYTFPDHIRRDPDNYGGKFLLDGLTKAKAIADDSFAHISLTVAARVVPGTSETKIIIEREG